MILKAVNTKNQSRVNKAVKKLITYNALNDERNEADGNGDENLYERLDRRCEAAFDRYEESCEGLPKYEIKAIEASKFY